MNQFRHVAVAGIVMALSVCGIARSGESEVNTEIETLKQMYVSFNAKDIDGVLSNLSDDVVWANGMDGGFVQGHEGIRDYWTRQWSIVNPHVDPVNFSQDPDGAVVVEVKQTIRDLQGNVVQANGLKDKTVGHVYHFANGKVARFDIREEN